MEMLSIEKELQENSYPGRGIVIVQLKKDELTTYAIIEFVGIN